MNVEFQQYRFARIEGHSITRARLEAQFKSGITDLDELQNAIAQQLSTYKPHSMAQIRNRENWLPGRDTDGGPGVFLVAPPRVTTCRSGQFSGENYGALAES